ncbi:MAG: NAD-dependent epimerase/dehydratase family protein [Gammaproteobacteria bacterium]
MITRALVTGANGFIGGNLCAALREQGIPVRGLVLAGTDTTSIVALGVEVVTADIALPLDPGLFAGVSHVFHLAAIALDWGPGELFERVNVNGTRHVLEAACAAGVMHVVHMSSLAVHPYTGHVAGDENTPRGWNINAYTRTKNLAEDIVQSFRGRLMVTIIRPGVVPYGPGDRLSLPGLVDALSRGIYAHVGAGRTRVCLSYVENLADGMILAACRHGESGAAYVMADDVMTWHEFIDAVADAFGLPRARRSVPFAIAWIAATVLETVYRLLRVRSAPVLTRYRISLFRGDLVFSSAKARRELRYRPRVPLHEGLRRTRAGLDRK